MNEVTPLPNATAILAERVNDQPTDPVYKYEQPRDFPQTDENSPSLMSADVQAKHEVSIPSESTTSHTTTSAAPHSTPLSLGPWTDPMKSPESISQGSETPDNKTFSHYYPQTIFANSVPGNRHSTERVKSPPENAPILDVWRRLDLDNDAHNQLLVSIFYIFS